MQMLECSCNGIHEAAEGKDAVETQKNREKTEGSRCFENNAENPRSDLTLLTVDKKNMSRYSVLFQEG